MLPVTLKEGSLAHRVYVTVPWVLLAAVVVYVPFASDVGFVPGSIDKAFRISQLNGVIAYAVAILGLTLVTGYSGQVSLGQAAFVGMGAYTTIILVADHNWGYVSTLPASALVCFAAGLVLGVPATRVKGMYLAIITLSVAYAFPSLVRKLDWLTGGVNGKSPIRTDARLLAPAWMPFADDRRLSRPLWVYCISVLIALVLFVLARNFVKSRPGRALVAVRDNELSAVAMGIDGARYKALAFGVSAMFGGIAGSLLMMDRGIVTPNSFDANVSIFLFVSLVVGGAHALSGAFIGAVFYLFVPYFLAEWAIDRGGMPPGLRQVVGPLLVRLDGSVSVFFGLALVLVMFFAPGGIVSGFRALRARLVVVVPSLPAPVRSGRR